MTGATSFFKREAIFTLLLQIGFPAVGLLFVLVVMWWRWLSR
ncbi:MAG TPA: hypothetical protein VF553_11885 [Pyrinomonadaceae bacterium]|jgi:hypothetical protein